MKPFALQRLAITILFILSLPLSLLAQETPPDSVIFFDDFSAYREPGPIGQDPESILNQVAEKAITNRDKPVLGWEVVRNSSHGHLHRQIDQKAYWITHQGNEHCPITPALKNFTLEFDARARGQANVAILFVDFHLDDRCQQGYRLFYRWGERDALKKHLTGNLEKYQKYVPKTTRLALLDYQHRWNLEPIINQRFPEFGSPAGADPVLVEAKADSINEMENVLDWQRFKIEVKDDTIKFYHNGQLQGTLTDPGNCHPNAGRIGFDTMGPTPTWPGAITLDNVNISTPDPLVTKLLFERNIVFPFRLNAIHGSPPTYTLRLRQVGDVVEVLARLNGGPAFDYGTRSPLKHTMVNPYIRIEDVVTQRTWPIVIFDGKVGGTYPEKVGPLGMNEHMGPVERITYLRDLPDRWRLHLGYDYYLVIGRDHQSGGPSEIVVSPTDGSIQYFGESMTKGFGLHVDSPTEKEVVNRLKPSNKFYEGFKTFMAENHYFCSGEPIRFEGKLWTTNHFGSGRPSLHLEILNAFFEPLGEKHDLKFVSVSTDPLGMNLLGTGFQTLKSQPPGVYHLRATLSQDDKILKVLTRAFEVLPSVGSNQSPAELSGLPHICFKPYVVEDAYQVDAYHYTSSWITDAAPDWVELSKAVCRKLYVQGVDLTSDETASKQAEIIRGSDGAFCPTFQNLNLCYFWFANTYAAPVAQELVRGYLADPATPKPANSKLADLVGKTTLSGATALYMDLRNFHWRSWIDYLNRRFAESHEKVRSTARKINPDYQLFSYGHPMPCGNDLIGLDFCRIGGLDFVKDNIFYDLCLFEGYFTDHRHSIDRTSVTMALMKMVCPRIKIIEDNEGDLVCVEDNQNARAWAPYGVAVLRPGFQKKALLLNMLATTYFDGQRFRWAWDNLYRPGCFIPERWREMIDASRLEKQIPLSHPVSTVAYAWDWKAIRAYDFVWDDLGHPYNPADEMLVFAGEEIPRSGVVGGFVCRLTDLDKLSSCNTLVLPPLKGVDPALISKIRKKYEAGVNLVGFQDVPGLEDLFGITPSEEHAEIDILAPALNPLAKKLTDDLIERRVYYQGHFGQVRYRAKDATPILEACDKNGKILGPALVVRKGRKASTAFWCVPPTDIQREHIANVNCAGESLSELVKQSMGRVVREISTAPVTTSAGQVLAFWGTNGKLYVLIYENAFPNPSVALRPTVTIRMPNIEKAKIDGDMPYEVSSRSPGCLSLTTTLEPEGLGLYVITPGTAKSK